VTRAEPRLDPALERAWQALVAGNLALAKEEYARVLAANPLDRDAQLGLATIDVRSQDYEGAEARYLRVLELDPRNPYAQAGIISLRGHTDPVLSESRLKILLAQQPEATFLNFALGNLYALQGRWQDAQSAYFKAYSADPEHPDYAYNLAVSLDQLHQPKLALEYYQRALALARNRALGFNSALVEARVRELAR
jgi:tetratricopeptide (TPR) repeat protein